MISPESADVDSTPALVVVPPRPSPGPEPIAASLSPSGLLAVLAAVALILAGAFRVWRRRPRAAAPAPSRPADPWEALTTRVRQSLVASFGPEAASWTAPEWSTHPDVIARFGAEAAAVLAAFARDSDAARFGGRAGSDPEAWRDRLALVLDRDSPPRST